MELLCFVNLKALKKNIYQGVYGVEYIVDNHPIVKIGYSENIKHRISALGNTDKRRRICILCNGSKLLESSIHYQLRDLNIDRRKIYRMGFFDATTEFFNIGFDELFEIFYKNLYSTGRFILHNNQGIMY